MEPIRLECQDGWKGAKPEQLVQKELDGDDCAYYDEIGWEHYRDEYHLELPQISDPLYFRGFPRDGFVVEIRGKRWKVNFEDEGRALWDEDDWSARGKYVTFTPTDEPLSVPDGRGPTKADWLRGYRRGGYYVKLFGQPTWVQGTYYPLDLRGKPCCHLMTIENGWGDSGNYNILVGFDENDNPEVVYFEASCC